MARAENIDTKDVTNDANDEVGDNDDDETESGVDHLSLSFFNGLFFVTRGNPFKTTKDEVDGEGKTGGNREGGEDGGKELVENRRSTRGKGVGLLIFADTGDGVTEIKVSSKNFFHFYRPPLLIAGETDSS